MTGQANELQIFMVPIDFATPDVEYLCAAYMTLLGTCYYDDHPGRTAPNPKFN